MDRGVRLVLSKGWWKIDTSPIGLQPLLCFLCKIHRDLRAMRTSKVVCISKVLEKQVFETILEGKEVPRR